MKVLILGAKGNLGGQLVKVFRTDDNEVTDWDKEEIDITDRELIIKKVKDIKPDVIINAAAYNAVDKCEESAAQYEIAKKVNIDGPRFLAEAALASRAILVHYSSDYVFDGKKKRGYVETDEPNPINKYGKTKYQGEKKMIGLSGAGLKWYLIRTSKLFGPTGESKAVKPSFFDLMLKQSKGKDELEVVNQELSCFTYTLDLAQATSKLIASKSGYGIYHLVNPNAYTWYGAAKEFFKVAQINIKIKPVSASKFPRPAKRPKYSVLLNTKFKPLRSFEEALADYWKELKVIKS
ncbi:MAG: dTDP-4-dehydrorhamnose reductase [Candidatus Falkowbacteria bacterium]|nr:dTDP-4-dehydrorhamnose reductase [Candidatus Falkowbacteria bacterium]